jgi:outer membrane lipase/esterase
MNRLTTMVSALALTAALVSAPALADEPSVRNFVVFGDSLSDDGNISGTLGIAATFPPAPFSNGRFSNGAVFTEMLEGILGASSYSNFAHGGAFTGQLEAPGAIQPFIGQSTFGNIGLASSLGDYLAAGATPAGLNALARTDVRSQISQYIASGASITDDDLFSVYAGANNYFYAANAISAQIVGGAINPTTAAGQAAIEAQVAAAIGGALGDVAAGVTALANAGADQILLPNLPNLGRTPLGVSANAELFSTFSDNHNANLAAGAASLASAFDLTIYLVDVETLIVDILDNPGKYGFTNTTTPCIAVLSCVTGNAATQNSYVFFDDVHPTTAVHEIAAQFAADTFFAPRTIPAQAEVVYNEASAVNALMIAADRVSGKANEAGETTFLFDVSMGRNEREGEMKAFGFETDSRAISAGLVRRLNETLSVGSVFSYRDSETDLSMNYGGFETEMVQLGGFVGLDDGDFSLLVGVNYAMTNVDGIERNTGVAAQVARAETEATSFGGFAEARYAAFGGEGFQIYPLVRLYGNQVEVDGYTEAGAVGLDQIVWDRKIAPMHAEAGAELQGKAFFNWRIEGVYVEQFEGNGQEVLSALVTQPDVVRAIETDGTSGGYGRFAGAAQFDIGDLGLEIGGMTTAGRDEGDGYGAFLRLIADF